MDAFTAAGVVFTFVHDDRTFRFCTVRDDETEMRIDASELDDDGFWQPVIIDDLDLSLTGDQAKQLLGGHRAALGAIESASNRSTFNAMTNRRGL